MNPQTEMGKELKYLVSLLKQTNSPNKINAWGEYLFSLGEKYKDYLSQRTYQNNGNWEYTHRRDRSCYYQLTRLFNSGDLFRCISEFCFNISKTTNSLEGGINSRIKDLIRRHRGCSEYTKSRIVEFYLITRTKDSSFEKLSRLFV